jgi:hypothetical protein
MQKQVNKMMSTAKTFTKFNCSMYSLEAGSVPRPVMSNTRKSVTTKFLMATNRLSHNGTLYPLTPALTSHLKGPRVVKLKSDMEIDSILFTKASVGLITLTEVDLLIVFSSELRDEPLMTGPGPSRTDDCIDYRLPVGVSRVHCQVKNRKKRRLLSYRQWFIASAAAWLSVEIP